MKNKFWKIIEIIAGIIFISIALKGFYPLTSAEVIGFDFVSLLVLILGGYWIYDGIKNWKRLK